MRALLIIWKRTRTYDDKGGRQVCPISMPVFTHCMQNQSYWAIPWADAGGNALASVEAWMSEVEPAIKPCRKELVWPVQPPYT